MYSKQGSHLQKSQDGFHLGRGKWQLVACKCRPLAGTIKEDKRKSLKTYTHQCFWMDRTILLGTSTMIIPVLLAQGFLELLSRATC